MHEEEYETYEEYLTSGLVDLAEIFYPAVAGINGADRRVYEHMALPKGGLVASASPDGRLRLNFSSPVVIRSVLGRVEEFAGLAHEGLRRMSAVRGFRGVHACLFSDLERESRKALDLHAVVPPSATLDDVLHSVKCDRSLRRLPSPDSP